MTDRSARFALPYLFPGQAQKEVFHNEALAAIDSVLHLCVEGVAAEPAIAPEPGESWIVAEGSIADWDGKDDCTATWTEGGWRFTAPVPGMLAWDRAASYWRHWSGTAWIGGVLPASALHIGGEQVVGPRLAAIASPSGGTTIDNEARAAIAAVIATLMSHGLID